MENHLEVIAVNGKYFGTSILLGFMHQEKTFLSVLAKDVTTVHPSLLSSLDDIGRSQVEELLRRLGVKMWTPKEVVNNHIIPVFKSKKWKV